MDEWTSGGNYKNQPSGTYGGSASLEMPESASRLRDSLGATEQYLSELHGAIAQLEKRLDTVLLPASPQATSPPKDTNRITPQLSHVSGRIVILNEGFAGAAARIRDLTQRVDV